MIIRPIDHSLISDGGEITVSGSVGANWGPIQLEIVDRDPRTEAVLATLTIRLEPGSALELAGLLESAVDVTEYCP
jgi:hypothetical protein